MSETTCKALLTRLRAGAEDALTLAQLRREHRELQTRVDGCLLQLGEGLYRTHRGSPADITETHQLLSRLDALRGEQDAVLRRMKLLRGVLLCPACAGENDASHGYCRHCGKPLYSDN